MRLAVISDIHGNLEALQEVLADIDQAGVDRIISLGDNIGYGPDPEAVVTLVRDRNIPSVMGNHELAVVQPEYLSWFNDLAQRSLISTSQCLSHHTLDYCRDLPLKMDLEPWQFVHGFPPDSALTYLIEVSRDELRLAFETLIRDICFVGHTHLLEIISFDGEHLQRKRPGPGILELEAGTRHIVNVGSVGQPRDHNKSAKYVIWDDTRRLLDIRFVPYDNLVTAGKIMALGWPEAHARRLC